MTPRIIVSYDDTDNDRDALALGRLLAGGGADLSLAYVRHARSPTASARPSRSAPRASSWTTAPPVSATPTSRVM